MNRAQNPRDIFLRADTLCSCNTSALQYVVILIVT